MFNSATLYQARYGESLLKDFKEKWPDLCPKLKVHFTNCPLGGEKGWADCVRVYSQEDDSGTYSYTFSVYLGKLYGNCGLATVSGLDVNWNYYNKGMTKWLLAWIKKMLSEMGFTIAIGSTNPQQTAIEPKLIKSGWEEIKECNFINRRTKNQIKFWRINLPEYDPKAVPGMAHLD